MEIVMYKLKTVASSLAAVGLVAGLTVGGIKYYGPIAAHAGASEIAVQNSAPATSVHALPDFSSLVDKYGPAVVNISVMKNVKTGATGDLPGIDRNSPFYDFFRRFQIPMPEGRAPAGGIGSGFIVSPDGLILTNAHVVADASEVTVKLTDRREFKATVLGTDPQTDVAVLKIDARNLPAVKLGKANAVRVGEWVVAIGSPYGFENTVTSGIVSAKARSLPDGTSVPFIQTDVAVNPGNSGGPLFNLNGEVIGINSQIYSGTGGYQGLSFAIPIDVAIKVKDQLVQTGKVSRGRIGVVIQEINQPLAESFGLKKPAGALVSSVEKGSPAAKAGIEPGDVVLKADGKEINRSIDLSGYVAELKPGATAKLQVWRKGALRDIAVAVDEAKTPKMVAGGAAKQDGGRLGVAVRALSPEEQKEANVQGGLLVEDVTGPAARAGIQPGDVVLAVNGTPVKSTGELLNLVQKSSSNVALLVQREAARIFIPVRLG
jgi:serine protease Do